MIPAILALPDQPCQILLLIKDRLDAQRPRHLARHARHHRPREIDRPEPRIEPFQPGFPVMRRGRGNQRPAHQSSPLATARRTARAGRSEERSVGKESVSTGSDWGWGVAYK